jgi:Zn-dependent alcohol dehydrogenase
VTSIAVRAAVCRAFGEPLGVEELSLRAPLAGEVRLRVDACSICHSDIAYAAGAWGGDLPAVYGHEAAGTVVDVGAGVERVAAGDAAVVTLIRSCGRCRTCARGEPALCLDVPRVDHALVDANGQPVVHGLRTAGFADHVLVHESQVARIPQDVSPVLASPLGCGVITGVGAAVHTARIEPGATVVVVGAGGVGLNCIQGATLAGAGVIVAVEPVAGKREAARAFGATHAVDPAEGGVAEAVRGIVGADGADVVLVAAGSTAALETGIGLLGRGGTAVVVGMPPAGATVAIDPTEIADNGLRVVGSKMGSSRPERDIPWLLDLYREGRLELDRLVSGRYALEDVNVAIAAVRRGDALRNVIVFDGDR